MSVGFPWFHRLSIFSFMLYRSTSAITCAGELLIFQHLQVKFQCAIISGQDKYIYILLSIVFQQFCVPKFQLRMIFLIFPGFHMVSICVWHYVNRQKKVVPWKQLNTRRLPWLPTWLPTWLSTAGEDFVNVRFGSQEAADRAYAALKAGQVFVDGFPVGVGPAGGKGGPSEMRFGDRRSWGKCDLEDGDVHRLSRCLQSKMDLPFLNITEGYWVGYSLWLMDGQ